MNFEISNFNDFRHESCQKIYQIYEERTSKDFYYEEFREMIESLREPIGIAINVSPEILKNTGVFELFLFSDFAMCKRFEGFEMDWRFTPEMEHMMH